MRRKIHTRDHFVAHFGPSGAIERFLRFSTCLEGNGDTFFSLTECRTCPKYWHCGKLTGSANCQSTRKGPIQSTWRATVMNWHGCAKQSLSRRVYARYNLARITKFRPLPLVRISFEILAEKFVRRCRFLGSWNFFDEHPNGFYAKPNITCIWNSRVTHLRCRTEKSYLEFWENL